jgi:dihydroneopterin aldolase
MDKIFINNLATRGKHGVSDEERAKEQEFVVDIEIMFNTRAAAKSDALDDTVDYNFFRNSAREVVQGRSFKLLERLADAIAQKVLEDARIKSTIISVRKTEMYPDCTPGVTIERSR